MLMSAKSLDNSPLEKGKSVCFSIINCPNVFTLIACLHKLNKNTQLKINQIIFIYMDWS